MDYPPYKENKSFVQIKVIFADGIVGAGLKMGMGRNCLFFPARIKIMRRVYMLFVH